MGILLQATIAGLAISKYALDPEKHMLDPGTYAADDVLRFPLTARHVPLASGTDRNMPIDLPVLVGITLPDPTVTSVRPDALLVTMQ